MAFVSKWTMTAIGAVLAVSATAGAQTASTNNDWMNRITINGEVRFRTERDLNGGGYQPSGVTTPGTGEDMYNRVRARLGVNAKVNDTMTAVTRLSTGRSQYTTWATLGQANDAQGGGAASGPAGFSERKDFFLDQVYLDYRGVTDTAIRAGKMPVSFWTPGDQNDVWNLAASLEGVEAKWNGDMGSLKPFAQANYSYALNKVNGTPGQAQGTDGADVMMLGTQLGLTWKTDTQWFTGALANYAYNNVRGLPSTVTGNTGSLTASVPTSMAANTNTQGNSITAGGAYAYEYNLMSLGLEYGMNIGFAPVKVYTDYTVNTMTSNDNTAWLGGVTIGKLAERGSWMGSATYRDIRKDAVMGAYSDIGFINGSTDVYGGEFQAAYQVWEKAGIAALYDVGHKAVSVANSGSGFNYEIYIFDVYATF